MRKVVTISAQVAHQLRGLEFMNGCTFNPIEDAEGSWVISEEEIKQCDGRTFGHLKALQGQARPHKAKAVTDLLEQDNKEKA